MTSIWLKHLIICLFLGLLAIPIYFMDMRSPTNGGGGNWITLDLRGLIFWTYIAFLVIDFVLSSSAVLSFPKSGVVRIHFCAMILSVVLLVTGVILYGKLLRAEIISDRRANLDREIAEEMALLRHGQFVRDPSLAQQTLSVVHPTHKTFYRHCRAASAVKMPLP